MPLKKTRSKPKEKRAPGRPHKSFPKGYCGEKDFFEMVRNQFTPRELVIFKTSNNRLKSLSKEERGFNDRYSMDAHTVRRVVDRVKASVINVGYIQECLGMEANQYNAFIRYIKLDALGGDSILAGKGYAIVSYFRERCELRKGKLAAKPGKTSRGLTFEQFEDLVKIAVHHWERLKDKFEPSRKKPKPITTSTPRRRENTGD